MAGRMDGKVVFITGAARGMGRSHAVRLAEEGADIIAVDICGPIQTMFENHAYSGGTSADLQETVQLVEKQGRRIIAEQADVRDLGRLKEVVNAGVAELGKLDGVVANAGIDIFKTWDKFTEQEFRDTIDINLVGVWNTVMATAPVLVDAGNGGSIVLISSGAGLKGSPVNMPYTASKFGVTGMAKALAGELGKHRIRVNSVHPGPVDTPLAQAIAPTFDDIFAGNESLLGTLAHYLPESLMDPIEISHAVLYLLSDESTWTTAHAMASDGGVSVY